jgi:hypothetical protein
MGYERGRGMMNLRPEVKRFAEEMERQLQANEHKGGWEDCTICHLIVELRRNSYELERAALRVDAGLTSSTPSVVRRAANVANFAMMVADNWGGEFSQKKPEPEKAENWDEEGEHDD